MKNNPMQDLRCGAKTRSGKPCQNYKVRDGQGGYRKRCRMHGGADGSGAPIGNRNSYKHGRFTAARKKEKKQIQKSIQEMNQLLEDIINL